MEPRISLITLGVADLARSYRFYHEGLGFPASGTPAQGIIFFHTSGTRLALYPYDLLAADVSPGIPTTRTGFSGITLAHNTRTKDEVDAVLALAVRCGGILVKPAEIAGWGGYSGYFADPDGYLWEVAWSANWQFHDDGSLVIA